MSNRKNYNSIVFLTTLSVYLGLVLVGGATPSVLAQAATTRDFNIKNEIVVEDDLDKKPDDNCDEGREIDIAGVLVDFVNDLKSLRKNKLYDFKQEKSFYLRRERFVYPNNSLAVVYSEGVSSNFDKSLIKVLERLDDNNLQKLADFTQESSNKKSSKKLSLEFYSTLESKAKLFISVQKVSPDRATLLAENLNFVFLLKANRETEPLAKKIYEDTKAFSQNNQVFIVTRLPRGSIDSLLAEKNAQ